jgi:hypothetical protein
MTRTSCVSRSFHQPLYLQARRLCRLQPPQKVSAFSRALRFHDPLLHRTCLPPGRPAANPGLRSQAIPTALTSALTCEPSSVPAALRLHLQQHQAGDRLRTRFKHQRPRRRQGERAISSSAMRLPDAKRVPPQARWGGHGAVVRPSRHRLGAGVVFEGRLPPSSSLWFHVGQKLKSTVSAARERLMSSTRTSQRIVRTQEVIR